MTPDGVELRMVLRSIDSKMDVLIKLLEESLKVQATPVYTIAQDKWMSFADGSRVEFKEN